MEVGGLVEAHFKFGGVYGQVLVAFLRTSFGGISTDKFGGHSVCVCSVVVSVQQQTQEPPQEVLVVVMSCKIGGHLVQRK